MPILKSKCVGISLKTDFSNETKRYLFRAHLRFPSEIISSPDSLLKFHRHNYRKSRRKCRRRRNPARD